MQQFRPVEEVMRRPVGMEGAPLLPFQDLRLGQIGVFGLLEKGGVLVRNGAQRSLLPNVSRIMPIPARGGQSMAACGSIAIFYATPILHRTGR
jgi:hypothetical protein